MTLKEIDKLADELAEQYGLSPQLTLAWLHEKGIHNVKFSKVTLAPKQVESLCAFARV